MGEGRRLGLSSCGDRGVGGGMAAACQATVHLRAPDASKGGVGSVLERRRRQKVSSVSTHGIGRVTLPCLNHDAAADWLRQRQATGSPPRPRLERQSRACLRGTSQSGLVMSHRVACSASHR